MLPLPHHGPCSWINTHVFDGLIVNMVKHDVNNNVIQSAIYVSKSGKLPSND